MSRIESSNNSVLRLIEQYGVNHVGVRGRNFAMMYLAENCNKRALETFLQHKIDVTHQDDEGNTLTDYILRYQPNVQRAFRYVMRRGKFSLCEKNHHGHVLILRILKWAPTENKLFSLKRCNNDLLKNLLSFYQDQLIEYRPNTRAHNRTEENITLIQKTILHKYL